jgi:hypothetical protein
MHSPCRRWLLVGGNSDQAARTSWTKSPLLAECSQCTYVTAQSPGTHKSAGADAPLTRRKVQAPAKAQHSVRANRAAIWIATPGFEATC